MTTDTRPASRHLLILALGGQGGAVLADWIVATAHRLGLPVQATSVPGVAQRTGATSYYIEMLPRATADAAPPVFALSPTPGDIDLLVSSELLETGRALERGMADPDRTMVISSSARFLTVAEKMAMADGRVDAERIRAAATALCRESVFFDMADATRVAGTALSSVMFGAIAASGVLPLTREACEATIRDSGVGVQASLAGFERGFASVAQARSPSPASPPPAGAGRSLAQWRALGAERVRDHQDERHAQWYERRLESVVQREREVHASDAVSATVARHLALWMAYDDVIRVADLKSRPERIARIRDTVGAAPDEPVVIREFLKPGVDEIAAILPPRLAGLVRAWGRSRARRTGVASGLRWETTSVSGWLGLRVLASLRRWRPRSTRYAQEQAAIDHWLQAIDRVLAQPGEDHHRLAAEIAGLPRLLKGYGETWNRGRQAFDTILAQRVLAPIEPGESAGERAGRVAAAVKAALADPHGRSLARELGLPPAPPRAQPIRWVPRPGASTRPPV